MLLEQVRSSTTTATTGVRVLLEWSVSLVLLSVADTAAAAAAAAVDFSCLRGRMATRHENTLYPPLTYLAVFC